MSFANGKTEALIVIDLLLRECVTVQKKAKMAKFKLGS